MLRGQQLSRTRVRHTIKVTYRDTEKEDLYVPYLYIC